MDIKITRHECILSDNRTHVYYEAYIHGQHGLGNTEEKARAELKEKIKKLGAEIVHDGLLLNAQEAGYAAYSEGIQDVPAEYAGEFAIAWREGWDAADDKAYEFQLDAQDWEAWEDECDEEDLKSR